MNIKNVLLRHKNTVVVVCVLLIAALLLACSLIAHNSTPAASDDEPQADSNINPNYREIMENGANALPPGTETMADNTITTSTPAAKTETTAPSGSVPATTVKPTAGSTTVAPTHRQSVQYATAVRPATQADYSEQWDLGYLVAIDNPDKTYACAKVTLTDEDRDLLERLCMGEFGSGGFIGASLIAQAVKDAMCFDGFTSVADVITECHYTGDTDIGTNDECRQAVRYIFDENHDAVQHRILYMYNPSMVDSDFHESQNFILSYGGVRFFDRWGY